MISTLIIYINKIITLLKYGTQTDKIIHHKSHYHSSLAHLSLTDAPHAIILFTDSHIINATFVTTIHINNAHIKSSINPYNSIVKKYQIYGHVIIANHVLSVYNHLKIKPYHVPNVILTYIKSVLNSNFNKISSETNTHVKIAYNVKSVKRNSKISIMFSSKMDINVSTVIKHNKQIKFVTFVKNKVMADGHNVHDNFVENGSIKIVINTYKQEIISFLQIINKFITVHFVDV